MEPAGRRIDNRGKYYETWDRDSSELQLFFFTIKDRTIFTAWFLYYNKIYGMLKLFYF